MRMLKVAGAVVALVGFGSSGVAGAAPKNYCNDLKGALVGSTCQIQESDAGYHLNISFPTDYPDQQSVADYITQARDEFLNVAKSPAPRDVPFELDITPTNYESAIPPRGTQAVVFKTYQNVGGAHPQTMYKAFNWDQTYRKAITYPTAADDKKTTPLWRVDDPLKVVVPIVESELQKQAAPAPPAPPAQPAQAGQPTQPGQPAQPAQPAQPVQPVQPVAISPVAAYDPMNYQNFAITNDGVIFFFSQGQLLPEAAGATQVLVPRSAIDPMLA